MFILKVTKLSDGSIQRSDFKTLQQCEEHLAKGINKGWWGEEEYTYTVLEQTIIHPEEIISPAVDAIPATPDIFNGNGELVTPGTPAIPAIAAVINPEWIEIIPAHDVTVPRSYNWEIIDKSVEAAAEESKKADRVDRVEQLKNIHWNNVDTLADLKGIVRLLVKESLKHNE